MSELRIPIIDNDGQSIAIICIRETKGRHVIERSRFINSFSRVVDEATAFKMREFALSKNWKAFNNFDPEILPWYCPKCEQNYAESKWRVRPIFEGEDLWLDSHRGRCPQGHERMIAD